MRNSIYMRCWMPIGMIAVLGACEPVPTSQRLTGGCANGQACQAAAFLAQSMEPMIGTDAGMGMRVDNVQAVGTAVVMDMRAPDTAAALGFGVDPRFDALMQDFITDSFALGACTPDPAGMTAQPFFDLGGQLRLRMISSDGVVVADSSVTSCRGMT